MQFTTAFVVATAMFFTNLATAATTGPRAALIATDPIAACNCPNNCDHALGDSCAYYLPDSTTEEQGFCMDEDGGLTCVVSA